MPIPDKQHITIGINPVVYEFHQGIYPWHIRLIGIVDHHSRLTGVDHRGEVFIVVMRFICSRETASMYVYDRKTKSVSHNLTQNRAMTRARLMLYTTETDARSIDILNTDVLVDHLLGKHPHIRLRLPQEVMVIRSKHTRERAPLHL